MRHIPGTPLRALSPRSANRCRDPVTIDAEHLHSVDDFVGAGQRGAGAAKGRDEPVTRRVDFTPAEALQLVAHDGVVVVR